MLIVDLAYHQLQIRGGAVFLPCKHDLIAGDISPIHTEGLTVQVEIPVITVTCGNRDALRPGCEANYVFQEVLKIDPFKTVASGGAKTVQPGVVLDNFTTPLAFLS